MSVLTAARAVLERGLWRNPHLHPEATVEAAISSEIGKLGSASRFRMSSPGRYTTTSRGA